MKALIYNGTVIQVTNEIFPVNPAMQWVICPDDCVNGWTYEGEAFNPHDSPATQVIMDILSTDLWAIPADGQTYATVTYTSEENVYFAVNDTIHTITPIDSVATLEITADAPGPIKVQVKYQQLIIAAEEVPL